MAETYTTRLRAVQQEYNSNPETWGTELNIGGLEIIDKGWGTTEVTVNGNVTLTVANKVADQARGFTLILTGAGGFTVTTPAVDKPYYVINNCAADVSVKPVGGTTATIRAGTGAFYYTNSAGSTGYVVDPTLDKIKTAAANVPMGGNKFTGLGAASASGEATTFANRLDQFAAPTADVSINNRKLTNLADPIDGQDAATRAYVISQTAASVAAAAASATAAAGSATAAATSATNAANSATAAALSASDAANIYDQFDDRWLGAKSSDPTVDNDGNTLLVGAAYWNTVANQLRIWSGSNWVPIAVVTLASQAQAEAGTDNTTVMTPLRTKQAIDALTPPAGRSTFTATGTLPNGATVVLNSDGTVSTVTSNNDTTGTATVFRSATTTYIASAALSATQVVVCYYDGTNAQAVIGTISGTSVSFGTAVTILGSTASYLSVCALSSTSFVVAMAQATSTGRAYVGTVSGTTITMGSAFNFNSASTAHISIAALSSTAVVIAYQDTGNSSYGTAIIGTISGTTISFGSEYVFNSATSSAISVAMLSATSAVVGYNSGVGSCSVNILTVSGSTISVGAAAAFDPSSVTYSSIVALTSTTFMIAWARGTTDGRAKIGNISGTTVTFPGSDVVFNNANTAYISAVKLSATQVAVTYADAGNSSYGTLVIGTVSSLNITFGSEIVYRSAAANYTGACAIGSNVFIGYQDGGNSSYGTGVVFQPAFTNVAKWIGITAASIANGASGLVTMKGGGIATNLSGLTTDTEYYLANDGSLTTTATSYKVGRAVNATTIPLTGNA